MIVAFPSQTAVILLVQLSGTAFVLTWMLTKYAHYPEPLGLLPSLVLVGAVLCPPIMILLLPHDYLKAQKSLSTYLE